MNTPWLSIGETWAQLLLHVQPGAKTTGIAGVHGDALKVRIAAAAIDGRANEMLRSFVAQTLSVPVRCVTIRGGEKSRRKILRIAPLDTETIPKLKQMGSGHAAQAGP